jgi:hypothetical protein
LKLLPSAAISSAVAAPTCGRSRNSARAGPISPLSPDGEDHDFLDVRALLAKLDGQLDAELVERVAHLLEPGRLDPGPVGQHLDGRVRVGHLLDDRCDSHVDSLSLEPPGSSTTRTLSAPPAERPAGRAS